MPSELSIRAGQPDFRKISMLVGVGSGHDRFECPPKRLKSQVLIYTLPKNKILLKSVQGEKS